ncbi:hypothetical protein HA47_00750 [Pantoea stewartii subsp. indologenes]|nr:hypothetical protein HA47_00750 [Pantoea stewartii subsp. indologenes]
MPPPDLLVALYLFADAIKELTTPVVAKASWQRRKPDGNEPCKWTAALRGVQLQNVQVTPEDSVQKYC